LGDYCSASCKAAQQVCYEHAVVPACTLFEETEARLETEKRTDRGMKEWCDLNEGPATKKPFLSLPFCCLGPRAVTPTAPDKSVLAQIKQCISRH